MSLHERWALILVLGIAPFGCHERATVEKQPSSSDSARHPSASGRVGAPGIVEPWGGEVLLAALESGVLTELLAAEGEAVKKGQLVARLEDSAQRAAMDVARAEIRQARADLDGSVSTPEELRLAQAEFDTADHRLSEQRREAARAEALGENGVIALANLDSARSALSVAESTEQAARARLDLVARGARGSERRAKVARLEAAEARLASTAAAAARREVRAPLAGVVMWSRLHVGEFYAPGTGPLMVLGDVARLQVRIEVDDVDGAALAEGARCELHDDSGGPLGGGRLLRTAVEYASRRLPNERPTDRTDARVREAFIEVVGPTTLASGRRVWAYCEREARRAAR